MESLVEPEGSVSDSKQRFFARLKAVIIGLVGIALACGFLRAGYRNFARIRHVQEVAATSTLRPDFATVTDKQQYVSAHGRLTLTLSLKVRGKLITTATSDAQKWARVNIGDVLPVTMHLTSDRTSFLEDWQPANGAGKAMPK